MTYKNNIARHTFDDDTFGANEFLFNNSINKEKNLESITNKVQVRYRT